MATNEEKAKALDLENMRASQSEEEIRAAAQTDKVVRGVNGGLTPKARKLRPLAGLIIIALVVMAAAYMKHGLANRNRKAARQTDVVKVGVGPAISVESGLLSDQARNGFDIGQLHGPKAARPRSSITGLSGGTPTTSIPPLEYRPSAASTAVNGSLSFEEQRRLEEYNREREAMEAGTSVKGTLPEAGSAKSSRGDDPLQAIQSALVNARVEHSAGSSPELAGSVPMPASLPEQHSEYERQNDQEQKTSFGSLQGHSEPDYLGRQRKAALSNYEIKAGWLIPAVLEQQLNSDLPGLIRALVRENVYDSVTGRYILLPAGSTLVGIYNSHVGYGQSSLQAVWRRVIFPDGSSLSLGGFEGDDSTGAAGFRDRVDSHWGRILSGALLTSLFAAGIELSQGTNASVLQSQSVGQQIGQAVGQQVGQLGTEVTRRNLNVQPTLVVRPGYRFFVRVEKDILFSGPYSPMTAEGESELSLGREAIGSQEEDSEGQSRGAALDGRPPRNDTAPPH